MDRSDEMAFDARGLLRHEARLQADLRVTTLPEGMDPDEVVLRDPEEWQRILEAAQPVVIHVMETLAAGRNLDDPKVKSEIAAQVLPLIEDVPNPVERDAYRQRLARLLRVDERALAVSSPRSIARPARRTSGEKQRPTERKALNVANTSRHALDLEAHTLSLLLRQPEALHLLDRFLLKGGLSRLGVHDFELTDHQMLFSRIQQSLEQDELEPQQYIQHQVPETLASRIQTLLLPMPMGEPNAEQAAEDLVRTVLTLRLVRVTENVAQVRYLQEELQAQGDLSFGPYQELFVQYTQTLNRLNKALGSPIILE